MKLLEQKSKKQKKLIPIMEHSASDPQTLRPPYPLKLLCYSTFQTYDKLKAIPLLEVDLGGCTNKPLPIQPIFCLGQVGKWF